MPDKANDPLPKAPDLRETAEAIARGRELPRKPSGCGTRRIGRSKAFRPPLSRQIAPSTTRTRSWATCRRAVRLLPRQHLRATQRHDTKCGDAESTVRFRHDGDSRTRPLA